MARIQLPASPRSLLVLGHGAGGDVSAPDLTAVAEAGLAAGIAVARVTQPYRVAGRRAPAPPGHLDEAWVDVLAVVGELVGPVPLVVGGRSSGARVACRTARAVGAVGVVALAFPTHPPGKPERTRTEEIPTDIETVILNGERDPFGLPGGLPSTAELHVIPGADHSLKNSGELVAGLLLDWLRRHGWAEVEF
jgi:predicted alpha/beta-hydrolase family hydrolase